MCASSRLVGSRDLTLGRRAPHLGEAWHRSPRLAGLIALVVSLPAMSDEARGDEAELWVQYERMRPALLGALLDAAVYALGHRMV